MKNENKNAPGLKVQKNTKINIKKLGKNKQSINRFGNKLNNNNNNKFIDKKNNTLLINHPHHMIFGDIDKNHYNNNNINYANKVNNGINNNSINLCSIRSLDIKEINTHKKINNI